jgi:hypothetical protein
MDSPLGLNEEENGRMIFFETCIGITGIILLVWMASIRRMPLAQRPVFSATQSFRWVVPFFGLLLSLGGFGLAFQRSLVWGSVSLTGSLIVSGILLGHDQYSAMVKILYEDYLTLKRENPQAAEFDLLYSIVKSHNPRWLEDRIMEVCVGKDIKQLILLLLVIEYQIHPLNDMRLYERLKRKVQALVPAEARRQ